MSSFNVSAFKKSSFEQDFYRPNLFEVTIANTNAAIKGIIDTDFKFMCKKATIPGQAIGTNDISYMNRTFKVPGDMTPPEDVSFEIYNNQSMALRAAFIGWIDLIQGRQTGVGSRSLAEGNLTADFIITPFDRAGNPIEAGIVTLESAFPIFNTLMPCGTALTSLDTSSLCII